MPHDTPRHSSPAEYEQLDWQVTEKERLALPALLPARNPVKQLTVMVSFTLLLPVHATLSDG